MTAQQVNTPKINPELNSANETTINTKATKPSVSIYEVTLDMLNLIKDQSELLKINKSRANILKKADSKFHEVSVAFSPDNKTIYFTRDNYGKRLRRDKNGVNHLKIYKLIKVGEEWSSATELAFNSDS